MSIEYDRPDCDNNVKCSFSQLLCIEFDVIFDLDVEIDSDSIVITCGDGIRTRDE